MRPTNEKCQYCKFFDPHGETGECKRHAPIRDRNDDSVISGKWPKVFRFDWCGDYEPSEVHLMRLKSTKAKGTV